MNPRRLATCFAIALASCGCGKGGAPKPLQVSAAADLQEAFTEFAARFEAEHGQPVELHFGASGMLAQQIRSGARVDVYASANVHFVDDLERAGLVVAGTKRIYARGRLVVYSRGDAKIEIASLTDLLKPEIKRIAIANPVVAPYGIAASQALEHAGAWNGIQEKLVFGENVRQTLELARSGNADVAIVSLSLVRELDGKKYVVPEEFHKPIRQAAAVIKGTPGETAARRFLESLLSDAGRELLSQHGLEADAGPAP